MATVSDRKLPVPTPGNATLVGSYKAEIISLADYSPFGMRLAGRTYNNTPRVIAKYRYGFNGKEADDEMMAGSTLDYGMRVYDARVGRFLSVDPLMKEYPELTPYQFASNKPIWAVDIDGLESWELSTPSSYLKQQADLYKIGTNRITGAPMLTANTQKETQFTNQSFILQGRKSADLARAEGSAIKRQYAFDKEMARRSGADPVSYGSPGMGLGLARDPFVQTTATTMATAGVANMASNYLFQSSLSSLSVGQQFAIKASVDLGGQALFNGARNVDVFDATLSGLPVKPAFSSLLGAGLDFRPFTDEKVSVVGLNKSVVSFGVEATFKYTFGSGGLPGTVKNQYKPSFNLKDAGQLRQYDGLNYMISVPPSLVGKGAAKATKELIDEKKN